MAEGGGRLWLQLARAGGFCLALEESFADVGLALATLVLSESLVDVLHCTRAALHDLASFVVGKLALALLDWRDVQALRLVVVAGLCLWPNGG